MTRHILSHRPELQSLIQQLHKQSLDQEHELQARGVHYPSGAAVDMSDQLVALDEDKAVAMCSILRAANCRRVVEAGTSHGVSLLWLLAAVLDNEASGIAPKSSLPSLVVGTENEPHKVAIALKNVEKGFGTQPACLNLLQGDILETLPRLELEDDSIDALLLDIWSVLALPTLKILLPKLRTGAIIFIDNTVSSADRYSELLSFLRGPDSGFSCCALPYSGGFELCVKT